MKIGIDATNISSGGGLTHLREVLNHANPKRNKFDVIVVWCTAHVANALPNREYIKYIKVQWFGNIISRAIWKYFYFDSEIIKNKCDVLYSPGANYSGGFRPYVSCSQNLLPFEKIERDRFKYSFAWFRYLLLNQFQKRSFCNASGVIFLSRYAEKVVVSNIKGELKHTKIIPHGISHRFEKEPVLYSEEIGQPYRWLYISIVNLYKHQWNVVKAVKYLKKQGFNIHLDLVGPGNKKAMTLLESELDGTCAEYITYHGNVPYEDIERFYHNTDAFIFASSCENLPNILLEAMNSGLVIACSNKGPMPEVLGSNGVYFDPENVSSITSSLKLIMSDRNKSFEMALSSYESSKEYTWERCADSTFEYIRKCKFNHDSAAN